MPRPKALLVVVVFISRTRPSVSRVMPTTSRCFSAADKREEFERGEVTVTLPLFLPPGRYHVDAVAKDVDAGSGRLGLDRHDPNHRDWHRPD